VAVLELLFDRPGIASQEDVGQKTQIDGLGRLDTGILLRRVFFGQTTTRNGGARLKRLAYRP
jgi:hypothetical protein